MLFLFDGGSEGDDGGCWVKWFAEACAEISGRLIEEGFWCCCVQTLDESVAG